MMKSEVQSSKKELTFCGENDPLKLTIGRLEAEKNASDDSFMELGVISGITWSYYAPYHQLALFENQADRFGEEGVEPEVQAILDTISREDIEPGLRKVESVLFHWSHGFLYAVEQFWLDAKAEFAKRDIERSAA